MKIISYNVNGIRSAISKGLIDWLKLEQPDIICFQELKAAHDKIPVELFGELGYSHAWFPAQKPGYSGVGMAFRVKPDEVISGMGHEMFDFEGRVQLARWGNTWLLNAYFPSGTTGDVRQEIKYTFLDYFQKFADDFRKENARLIVTGDYNIAHREIDIHNPVSNKNSSGFLPEERAWMSSWFSNQMHDAFRTLNPEEVAYSWWSFRANARKNNKGWRIDYFSLSSPLLQDLKSCYHLPFVVHSDHCPVVLQLG